MRNGIQNWWRNLPMGTKSVLLGAHCFFLHPWFVAMAWWRLYGFPWDPRLWAAFFLHDCGYIGKPAMDDAVGETHPELGARIMGWMFDFRNSTKWHDFCLLHSRYYAKKSGKPFSKLCVADKLAFCCTPRWLYLPMVRLTGEIDEYVKNARSSESGHFKAGDYSEAHEKWHRALRIYMMRWVSVHRDGAEDTWTTANRHADATGVWR